MPGGSSSALALAARLRALDDVALTALIRSRGVRTVGIRDWFDLAETLLDRAGVQTALRALDRPTLAVLAALAELAAREGAVPLSRVAERIGQDDVATVARIAGRAADAGLLGEESGRFAPWDAVIDQLAAWPSFGLPSLDELLWTPAPAALLSVTAQDREQVDRAAGELAFTTTGRVTELVLELRREPARRLAKGGIALPETRRLAGAAAVESDDIGTLLMLAERASLIADDGAHLVPTDAGSDWLDRTGVDRWAALADAWLDRLPDDIRTLLTERAAAVWDDALLDYLHWFYPAGGEEVIDRVRIAEELAALLGITAGATPSTAGAALLADGLPAAVAAMADRFPGEVDRVYLQHDLSIVSPGPLAAPLDARLRSMADAESRGLASTYRVTADSLTRGMIAGETATSMREFLAGISSTGVPQPLDYLLRDTAERFGALRVGALPPGDTGGGRDAGARSYARSDDPAIIGQLVVDSSLAPLALVRTGDHRAVSRFDATLLYWTLLDARYPVVSEDADGVLRAPARRPAPVPSTDPARDAAAELVARLRGAGAQAGGEASGEAWIARQLELAARARTPVIVTVRMPDGSETDFRLEPASVAGGRLRARDPRADLERTLPLKSITAVQPLG